jgi:hypothetical protein
MQRGNPANRIVWQLSGARLIAIFVAAAWTGAAEAAPAVDNVLFAPHRAVYELKLAKARGGRRIDGVSGRIVYDFSGSACEGYSLQFRQVSALEVGEGRPLTSDMRATSWEAGDAKSFRFHSENRTEDGPAAAIEGSAERKAAALTARLVKPHEKNISLPDAAVFPTEHMRRIVIAASEGKSILEFPVYDGSETGEKVFNTLTVIGRTIAAGAKPPSDAISGAPQFMKLTRWPVTISYFDPRDPTNEQTGEQTPVYAISFELYENGVSRALKLDYPDFTISGELTSLDMKKEKPCP